MVFLSPLTTIIRPHNDPLRTSLCIYQYCAKWNVEIYSTNKKWNVEMCHYLVSSNTSCNVIVDLTQLVETVHNICNVRSSNLGHQVLVFLLDLCT